MSRSKRSKAREITMQMLFQMELQGDFSLDARDLFLVRYLEDDSQITFIYKAYQTVSDNLDSIDNLLDKCSDNWKTSRMPKVDLTILRLAAAEIKFFEDVPTSVSANEAVDLAKLYGGEESSKFINGVLGKLIEYCAK